MKVLNNKLFCLFLGLFQTFLETLANRRGFTADSVLEKPFGRCQVEDCSATFCSTTEAEGHMKHGE